MASQRVSSSHSTGNDMEHLSKSDASFYKKQVSSRSEESHERARKRVRSNDTAPIDISEFKDRDRPIFVEACTGGATLSFSIQRRGFDVYPLDCIRNRHRTQCRVLQLDLTLPSTWELLRRITDDYFCAGFHYGVPCGTCSPARGIPLEDGSEGPPPLRDQDHVLGLPDLSETDRQKVESANILYERCCEFILFLDEKGGPVDGGEPNKFVVMGSAVLWAGQKNKLRPIDDMKENRLNESFTCSDKIDLKSLDQILCFVDEWSRRGSPKGLTSGRLHSILNLPTNNYRFTLKNRIVR